MNSRRVFPSFARRGFAHKVAGVAPSPPHEASRGGESATPTTLCAKPRGGVTGWSVPDNFTASTFTMMTHPVCAASEASRLFHTGAATPPVPGEGNTLSLQFIHTF